MTRRLARSLQRDRRGVTTVDFALTALPLLLLVLGTIEFGRLLWAREALQMTAIQAARCIGVLQSDCSAGGAYSSSNTQSYIQGLASSWGISLSNANMTLTSNATTGSCSGLSTHMAEVTLSYTFQTAVPGLLTILSGGKSLTGHACFPNQT